MLEVGCAHGHIGKRFSDLGAAVTGFDVRSNHAFNAKRRFPELNTFAWDLNNGWPFSCNEFDVILHLGTLYHLAYPHSALIEVCSLIRPEQFMILETEYVDSANPWDTNLLHQLGWNVAINQEGVRPSIGFIESTLDTHGLKFVRVTSGEYNTEEAKYDYRPVNDGSSHNLNIRGIWYISKH